MSLLVAIGVVAIASRVVSAAPCDIYASGDTPCVAAHSTTRALFDNYLGPLYQIKRDSDGTTTDVSPFSQGGSADSNVHDFFCSGTSCVITIIYDQSDRGNHLTQAPPGGNGNGAASNGFDLLADASAAPVSLNGQKVYGVYISPGMGYRNDATNGVATGDDSEGMYAVFDGTHYNDGCCFDYGNAEISNLDTGNGHMEAIYFGSSTFWGKGTGSGPWIMADLENGVFSEQEFAENVNSPSMTSRFVTAVVKGEPNRWSIRGADAMSASLSTLFDGPRSTSGGYDPMSKEGAIILGIGGDNSLGGQGTFYEGVMTSGFPSDDTEDLVQANIALAKYAVL